MCAAKAPDAQLFETMNAQDLNKKLSELMDGLSVKASFLQLTDMYNFKESGFKRLGSRAAFLSKRASLIYPSILFFQGFSLHGGDDHLVVWGHYGGGPAWRQRSGHADDQNTL